MSTPKKPPRPRGALTRATLPPAARRGSPQRRRKSGQKSRGKLWLSLGGVALTLVLALAWLFHWSTQIHTVSRAPAAEPDLAAGQAVDPTLSRSEYLSLELPAECGARCASGLLAERDLVDNSTLTWLAALCFAPFSPPVAGKHWLPRSASPHQFALLLGRSTHVLTRRVTLPEGWDSFQMAERLASQGICAPDAFLEVVFNASNAQGLVGQASLEGFLYPATYEFRPNSTAESVSARLGREGLKRFDAALEGHEAKMAGTKLTEFELLTLASVVQKEAVDAKEFGNVASVFLNRLRSPDFRPAQHLQSDPTAAYGCKVLPALPACRKAEGHVSRDLLRDSENPYNTYRHPGLPPGPIGNPSSDVVTAILEAPSTDYLFFFAPRGGRHHFSRTLDEHNAEIERSNAHP